MSKLIFIAEIDFGGREFERYKFERLKTSFAEVEVWSLQRILFPRRDRKDRNFNFYSKIEVLRQILALPRTVVIVCLIRPNLEHLIFRLLCCTIILLRFPKSFDFRIRGHALSDTPRFRLVGYLKSIFHYFFNLFAMRNILYGGRADYMRFRNNLAIGSWDYQRYLQSPDSVELIPPSKEKSIVFIDQFLPFHPDNTSYGIEAFNFEYYNEMNKFLRRVSQKFSSPIMVVLHPSDDSCGKFYDDDFLKTYDSLNAIRACKFVVAHDSAALSFAVLSDKPIMLFASVNHLKAPRFLARIFEIGAVLGVDRIMRSDSNAICDPSSFNSEMYDCYIRNFLYPFPELGPPPDFVDILRES